MSSGNEPDPFAIMCVMNGAENFGNDRNFRRQGGPRTLGVVAGRRRRGGLVWGSMEAGKASRSAMGSGLLRAAHVREDRPA